MDDKILATYKSLRKPIMGTNDRGMWYQYRNAKTCLEVARRKVEDAEKRQRFETIGSIIGLNDPFSRNEERDGYVLHGVAKNPRVKILVVPDTDYDVTDFDCCTTNYHGPRVLDGEQWEKCQCVVRRNPEDVTTLEEHERVCRYNQPCKHKCDEVRRAESGGVNGIVAKAKDYNGEWHEAYACWGFVDDDWETSGYLEDAVSSALDMLDSDDLKGC